MTTQPERQHPPAGTVRAAEPGAVGDVVIERGDGVEVKGLSVQDALDALALLQAARALQFELGSSAASGLLQTVSRAHLELTDPAPVEQARRLAGRRHALLATPVYTYATLAQVLQALLGAGVDGWPLRVWLTSSTPLLSGQVPAEVATRDPGRANQAAARFAARRRPAA